MSQALGRLESGEIGHSVLHDMPEKQAAAIMSKLDELVIAMKALTAKLDLDAGITGTDYAALITNSLSEILLQL